MTEQNTVALEEVVREFSRAREGLSSVVSKVRDLESAEGLRREHAEGLATATGSLSELSGQLTRAASSLEEATASVARVLEAAEAALQATDAGQLIARIDDLQDRLRTMMDGQATVSETVDRQTAALQALATAVQSIGEQSGPRLTAIEASSSDIATALGSVVARIDQLETATRNSQTLEQENAALRAQLEKVKTGLKPRQLASLGLAD